MKQPWHVLCARLSAANPSWPWSKACAEVGRRKGKAKQTALVGNAPVQNKYWWAKESD